jgi:hypothetical protein
MPESQVSGSEAPPDWPTEAEEAAYISESGARGEPESAEAVPVRASSDQDKLPGIDESVARIPPQVLELLDDLFRAKFISVRRIGGSQGGS